MATLTELCNDVYTLTNRPDLVAETQLAVRAATLKLHQSDFYFRDIFETGIKFDESAHLQQFNVKSVIPLFRSLKYIRRYDPSGSGMAAEYYNILGPTELLDSYNRDKVNVAYCAGDTVNIKSKLPVEKALLGVYVNPNVTVTGFSSWIAVDHPFAIVFEACRIIYKQIGYDEMAQSSERLAGEQLMLLKEINIQSVGY